MSNYKVNIVVYYLTLRLYTLPTAASTHGNATILIPHWTANHSDYQHASLILVSFLLLSCVTVIQTHLPLATPYEECRHSSVPIKVWRDIAPIYYSVEDAAIETRA